MPPQQFFEATTDAVSVASFIDVTQDMVPATLIATNLVSAEEAQVLVSVDDGASSQVAFQEGTAVVLTATDSTKSINSPMMVGVTKDATVSAGTVFLAYRKQT